MRRFLAILAVVGLLGAFPVNLFAQANLPNNPNAVAVQGPDPSGMLGYPLATVPATGALPWPVSISSQAPANQTSVSTTWTSTTPANTSLTLDVRGMSGISVQQVTAGVTANMVPVYEVSSDGGNNWYQINLQDSLLSLPDNDFDVFGVPWNKIRRGNVSGHTHFRVRIFIPPTGTGTDTVTIQATTAAYNWQTFSLQASSVSGYAQAPIGGILGINFPSQSSWLPPSVILNTSDVLAGASATSLVTASVGYVVGSIPNSATFVRVRTPDTFKAVATAAAGNTALWTPTAGRKFRLMRYMVTVVDQATQAAPGTVTISLFDGAAGATGQVHDVFVPALGLVNSGSLYTSGWIDLGNGYLSAAANNVLNINLSAALTAGTVRVLCCGTEE